jgi:hypothetical protein
MLSLTGGYARSPGSLFEIRSSIQSAGVATKRIHSRSAHYLSKHLVDTVEEVESISSGSLPVHSRTDRCHTKVHTPRAAPCAFEVARRILPLLRSLRSEG